MGFRFAEALESGPAGEPWRIVVTGSSGWIGRNVVDLLLEHLGPEKLDQRVHLFGSVPREFEVGPGSVIQRPMEELAALDRRPTLVLHLAFLTKDRAEVMDEAAYVAANLALRRQLIDQLDSIGAERLFVASSGAARHADDPSAARAMQLYGALKRDDEDAFADWATEQAKRAVICRIFSLTGRHMNKPDGYALAAFILQALNGSPILVKAPRPVLRSYVPVRELVTLIFALLLEQGDGVLRCESGGAALEMQEIAGEVARQLGVTVQRPIFDASAEPDHYAGDDEAYRTLLEKHGIAAKPFADQVADTISYLSSIR